MSCHTDKCPTGIATQDPARWKHLDAPDKATRVYSYHEHTLHALKELLCAAGLNDPAELVPEHILRRVSPVEIRSLASLYRYLEPGELLHKVPDHAVFHAFWADARSDSFQPPPKIQAISAASSCMSLPSPQNISCVSRQPAELGPWHCASHSASHPARNDLSPPPQ